MIRTEVLGVLRAPRSTGAGTPALSTEPDAGLRSYSGHARYRRWSDGIRWRRAEGRSSPRAWWLSVGRAGAACPRGYSGRVPGRGGWRMPGCDPEGLRREAARVTAGAGDRSGCAPGPRAIVGTGALPACSLRRVRGGAPVPQDFRVERGTRFQLRGGRTPLSRVGVIVCRPPPAAVRVRFSMLRSDPGGLWVYHPRRAGGCAG